MKFLSVLSFLALLSMPNLEGAESQDIFDQLLRQHVKGTEVDYQGLLKKRDQLDAHLESLKNTDVSKYNKEEVLAFWINAYNACTIKLILNFMPINSIKDIPASKRWKWQGWEIAGEKISLDDMEHVKLRPLGEPRIHFAINCASFSCPPLRAEAYKAATLEAQLESTTKAFLEDAKRGMALKKGSSFFSFGDAEKLHVSEIFSWFGGDFVKAEGSVLSFLKKHVSTERQVLLKDLESDGDLGYLEYDWSLNGK